jgi:hypothetical protein
LKFQPSNTNQTSCSPISFVAFRWCLIGNVALSDKTGFHQGWNEDFGDGIEDFLLTL